MVKAEIIGISRHRIDIDGPGVRTLVVFHGCPLHCAYCVNDVCHDKTYPTQTVSEETLLDALRKDHIYYVMSGGGITFGGGEPLLHADFIKSLINGCDREWNYAIETSLAAKWEDIEPLTAKIQTWIVDIKDLNDEIYFRYTGQHNSIVLDNIRRLSSIIGKERLIIRVPHIRKYNRKQDVEKTKRFAEQYGTVDEFRYKANSRENTSHSKNP